MRYFVVSEDGSKYGPADVALLNDWIEEGRLLPGMSLEEEGSKHRVIAASLDGLDFYVLESPKDERVPQGDVLALTYEPPLAQDSQNTDLIMSWSMVVVTLGLAAVRQTAGILGLFTAILGLMAALKAKDRGSETAVVAIAFNVLALVIWLSARLYFALR